MPNRKFKSHEYSSAGTNHNGNEQENQDVVLSGHNRNFEVAVVADGVSTCTKGKEGAEIAAKAIESLFLSKGNELMQFDEKQITDVLVQHMLYYLNKQAEADGISVEEYSSTMTAIVVDKLNKKTLTFNLGDGLIMGVQDGKIKVAGMPADTRDGTPTTTTKNVSSIAEAKVHDGIWDSTILCSNGAWKEMFNKNKLKPEIAKMILDKDFERVIEYLEQQETTDDRTFVALEHDTRLLEAKRAEMRALMEEGLRLAQEEQELGDQSKEEIGD